MKWINVKDRLPEYNEHVLIYFDCPREGHLHRMIASDPCSQVVLGIYYGQEDGHWSGVLGLNGHFDSSHQSYFTHWMPLPNAPDSNAHFSGCQAIHRIRNNCWNCKGMFGRGICDRGEDCDRKVKLIPKYRCVEGCGYKDEDEVD